jgi:hypothetical protein
MKIKKGGEYMAKKKKVEEDKHELHIILLGLVAVLAIVGLVLMFNARMATGKASASQLMPNPIYYGEGDPCLSVSACPNGPRTEGGQFLDNEGMLHIQCTCPPTTPPIPPIEVVVPVR